MRITIIDGYVDEPTCLGVPPYLSPYPRYAAGAIWNFDETIDVDYMIIDELRNGRKLKPSDLIVVIAGTTVPGKYLGGNPATPKEIFELLKKERGIKIICGPAGKYGFNSEWKPFHLISGDLDKVITELLESGLRIEEVNKSKMRKNMENLKKISVKGAKLVRKHPNFPNVMAEMETYRGCARSLVGGCSFCTEPSKGLPRFREVEDIVKEVKELYNQGVKFFRLGNQSCLFSYKAKGIGKREFPEPNPTPLNELYKGIRRVAPGLEVLHMDNANPGILAKYPEKSEKIAKTIVKYNTSGDVAALGVESADPEVLRKNNLKSSPEESMKAIELLNRVGNERGENGLPKLLPGVNLVFGLKGETKKTFKLNYKFLVKVLEKDLMIRRINLRQVNVFPGTDMFDFGYKNISKHKRHFTKFKRNVRREIDKPLLKKIVPLGQILKNIYTEERQGKITFGRQIGSYPLLIGIPGKFDTGQFLDVKIVGHGYRSLTGVPTPLDINTLERETLESIPGLGKKRAIKVFLNRPFTNRDEIKKLDKDIHSILSDWDIVWKGR